MLGLLKRLWPLERDLVSSGYDQALDLIKREYPKMIVHEYESGTECWTWTIPNRWEVRVAYIEDGDGRIVLDHRDHPLHVLRYSLPVNKKISHNQLLKHLHFDESRPAAIPYRCAFYDRTWGFCLSHAQYLARFRSAAYRVVIETEDTPGTLKVGEIFLKGKSPETIVLVVHLDHPYQANDDLSGVVVGLEVMKELAQEPTYYSYRLLILPETIGSIAYLSDNMRQIPLMVGGLFLDMLGNDEELKLQASYTTDSWFDGVCQAGWYSPLYKFREISANDERQFNSPGVRIPMLALSRIKRHPAFGLAFPEYHSSEDNPDNIIPEHLDEARMAVLHLLHCAETDGYVTNQFQGEIFASGYGMFPDYKIDPERHKDFFDICDRIDGSKRISEIANELCLPYHDVWETVTDLNRQGLVALRSPLASGEITKRELMPMGRGRRGR